MLVVLSGGGTAGHINPALALAEVLTDRGIDVRFAGTPQGREADLVPRAGLSFTPFEAVGFNRRHPLTLFKAVRLMSKSTKAAKRWFEEIKPDAVVTFGGYVCLPIGNAAAESGIPLIAHEQNSVMGIANKSLASKADAVCLTYEQAAQSVSDKSKVKVIGCPVRKSITSTTREEGRRVLGIPENTRMLLVTGGSLGARHLNQALCSMKDELLAREDLYVIHVTGPKEIAAVEEEMALSPDQAQRWRLLGYTNQMDACMAAADAIVSRAGASSLAEISARAIPAVLVPFPYATGDHQTMNAKAYVNAGCAHMIADDKVETKGFRDLVFDLVDNSETREAMTQAARLQKTVDAANALADIVVQAAEVRSS